MIDLTVSALLDAYRARRITPVDVVEHIWERLLQSQRDNVWITVVSREDLLRRAHSLLDRDPRELPLYGIPFAIKDNIDLAGVPTTAGCPAFGYVPESSAYVVQKLIDAGAMPIGKTNLDQFATGLVGTRSAYGACGNSFDPAYISGGSSAGSAVAVAAGIVSFSLGTDTAGSGRVPAAFNNVIGLKPSCGSLSTRGVVPACRSLDCVSIFALTSADAARVLEVAQGFDAQDEYSREDSGSVSALALRADVKVGVPRMEQRSFFGDLDYAQCYARSIRVARELGWQVMEIDFQPYLDAARLLYEGPWLAERYLSIAGFLREHANELYPVTRGIIERGALPLATDAFAAQYRLKRLQREAEAAWKQVDLLMLPTAGSIYTIEQVNADPVTLNSNLGTYTNFVNLLDLAAVAVPAGFRRDGLPFGVSLIARRGSDRALLGYADRLHRASVTTLGATPLSMPTSSFDPLIPASHINVVVCGAHMQGLPLNHQLQERGAFLVRSARTAAKYRFYALPGGPPKRPGLVRVPQQGASVAVEVWAVPTQHFGSFVAGIPQPLGIGKVELDDGSLHSGFLCESIALDGAEDITDLGDWRAYMSR
jgi:allophanate hydrolase